MESNIIKAVVRMLEEALGLSIMDEKKGEAFAMVKCSKIMLEELTKNDVVFVTNATDKPVKYDKSKPVQDGPQPELVVENGILKDIKNFDLNQEIKFNGKLVTAKDAIGKPFQSAEML